MNTSVSVPESVAELESRLGGTRVAAATSVRLLKLIAQVMDHWKQEETLEETAALTDSELLTKFAISGAVTTALEAREHRKLARRAAARIEFLASLQDYGGVLKAKKVAELLGVSRQTVNNHIVAGKLIAIKEGNDHLIPGFQFGETGKLEHLERVLLVLAEAGAEAKCTFFLNPIALAEGARALPYEVLKTGCSEDELLLILREAELFLTSTAS